MIVSLAITSLISSRRERMSFIRTLVRALVVGVGMMAISYLASSLLS